MKTLILSLILLAGLGQTKEVDHGKFVYTYEADTYKVYVLRYGAEENNQFLIKYSDTQGQKDGRITLHSKKCLDSLCKVYKYINVSNIETYNLSGWYKDGALQPYLVELEEIKAQDFINAYHKQQSL